MGDSDYEKNYKEKKKKLRELHKKLKDTKGIQEIYHKIMGSNLDDDTKKSKKTSK